MQNDRGNIRRMLGPQPGNVSFRALQIMCHSARSRGIKGYSGKRYRYLLLKNNSRGEICVWVFDSATTRRMTEEIYAE